MIPTMTPPEFITRWRGAGFGERQRVKSFFNDLLWPKTVHGTGEPTTYSGLCAAALTHPVTLGALAILLLNDLVLKALWPDPWTTGKLSDLAWVMFASPLLAWLISLPAGKNQAAQRAGWWASYAGLPLLYAAYNTFPVVHGAILRGISLLSGGIAGSPLDPTDSVVIPLGLAVALWVWRRGAMSPSNLRGRLSALMAGTAVIASVATSYPETHRGGVFEFALTERNTVLADGREDYRIAPTTADGRIFVRRPETSDGGFTWNERAYDQKRVNFSALTSVETPRGRFAIEGTDIVRTDANGSAEVVHSVGYLAGGSSRWVQIQNSTRLDSQPVSTHPEAIIYDPDSRNIIVAMGMQGVVVGTPEGEWTPVAVGPYRPTIHSRYQRTVTLLKSPAFWLPVILLPVVATAFVVTLALLIARLISPVAPTRGKIAPIIAFVFSFFALLIGVYVLFTFDDFGSGTNLLYDEGRVAIVVVGCWLAILAVGLSIDPIRRWHEEGIELITWAHVALSVLAMLACTVLMFVLWIQFNLSPLFVHFSALMLAALTGFATLRYVLPRVRS